MPTCRLLTLAAVSFLIPTSAAQSATPVYRNVTIKNVPHIKQKPDFCGEACAAMYLQKLGKRADQDAVFDQAGLDPALGRGCHTRELAGALKQIGFNIGSTWHKVAVDRANEQMENQFRALHADLARGVPSIICMHYNDRPNTTEHFRLILGYDAGRDEVIYHEPAIRDGAYQRMTRDMLLKLWPLKYNQKQWTVVRMPLAVKRLTAVSATTKHTDADYAQHILALKKKLPGPQFHVVIQKPFVVVGDEAKATVERRSKNTIKWAVDQLKKDYFQRDPNRILDIWLFKDKESYDKHTRQVFGDKPTTPFGYYSSAHGALVMNIATGGGTLVHEIVHPFMASNFPTCPSWFNEGLASLYEQCGEKNGHIYGYTNWRLRGLQQAIRNKRVPPFKTLCSTTTNEFYNEDPGTNYSQARYLCYYLQEKGLLVKYYHAFRLAADKDPTGHETLKKILGREDMDAFKTEWEAFAAKLR
jgi:hypothetical protein